MPTPQMISFSAIHQQLLDHIYQQLPSLFKECRPTPAHIPYPERFIYPMIVGGYAYVKYMQNSLLEGQMLLSDDIDIKLAIVPTVEQLNTDPVMEEVRTYIKLYRATLIARIFKVASEFLRNNQIEHDIEIKGASYSDMVSLLVDVLKPINPLQLCCLIVTYFDSSTGQKYSYGLIDTSFYIRDKIPAHLGDLTLKQYYAFLKIASGAKNNFEPGPDPLNARSIIGESPSTPHIAHPHYMILDTVRMLSKILTYEDVCISNASGIADVYKFKKYVIKFMQLAFIFHHNYNLFASQGINGLQMDPDRCTLLAKDILQTTNFKQQLNMLADDREYGAIYRHYLAYLPDPTEGTMELLGGRRKSGRKQKGGNKVCPNIGGMNADELYKEFELVIPPNEVETPIEVISFNSPKTTGGKKKRSANKVFRKKVVRRGGVNVRSLRG
jgi:hypothetical protein